METFVKHLKIITPLLDQTILLKLPITHYDKMNSEYTSFLEDIVMQ